MKQGPKPALSTTDNHSTDHNSTDFGNHCRENEDEGSEDLESELSEVSEGMAETFEELSEISNEMDESSEGLMANSYRDVVTVFKMQLQIQLKLLTVSLKMFWPLSDLIPVCSTITERGDDDLPRLPRPRPPLPFPFLLSLLTASFRDLFNCRHP